MLLAIDGIIDDKYRIVRLIGEGGMGGVYEGENVRINRRVAIKVLHTAVAGNKEAVQRFEREAQAAGRIGNDHILEVLDLGTLPDGQHYMVMEYLEGEPLSARIRRLERLTPEQAYPVIRQVLMGLDAAHGVGIVHRDLKPDNIFVMKEKYGQKDFVKIIDFGVSKFSVLSDDMKMTRTGAVVGTPYYMAPEQASGAQAADPRSDVYAVGVILYEAVTGQVPFNAATFNQLMFQIVLSAPIPAEQIVPDLDPAFATIISKAMARDPAHRFQSCTSLVEALDAWVAHRSPVTVPPQGDPYLLVPRPALGATAEALVGTGGFGAITPGGTARTPPGQPTRPGGFSPPRTPVDGKTLQSEPAPAEGGNQAAALAATKVAGATAGSWSSSGLSLQKQKSNLRVWLVAVGGVVVVVAVVLAWTLFGGPPAPTQAHSGPDTPGPQPSATLPAASRPAAPVVTPVSGDAGSPNQTSSPSAGATTAPAQAAAAPGSQKTTAGARAPTANRPRTPGSAPAQPQPPLPATGTSWDNRFGY